MKTLSGAIMEYAEGLPEAGIIRAKDLLHLGSRTAVDQALSRLAKRGHLLRVSQGFYVRILENSFGKYTPPVPQVIKNIANITGESVTPHPAATASTLRLTTQVPISILYITSGRSRRLRFGPSRFAELLHAPRWQFSVGNGMSGKVLRVAGWEGPNRATDTLQKIKSKLSSSDLQEMASARPKLPSWLAKQVGEFIANS